MPNNLSYNIMAFVYSSIAYKKSPNLNYIDANFEIHAATSLLIGPEICSREFMLCEYNSNARSKKPALYDDLDY